MARDGRGLRILVGVDGVANPERKLEAGDPIVVVAPRDLPIVVLAIAHRRRKSGDDRRVVTHAIHDDAIAVAAPRSRLGIAIPDIPPAELQELAMLAQEEAWAIKQHIIGDDLRARKVGEHRCAFRGKRLFAERDPAVVGAGHEPVRHLHVEAEIVVVVELTETHGTAR